MVQRKGALVASNGLSFGTRHSSEPTPNVFGDASHCEANVLLADLGGRRLSMVRSVPHLLPVPRSCGADAISLDDGGSQRRLAVAMDGRDY